MNEREKNKIKIEKNNRNKGRREIIEKGKKEECKLTNKHTKKTNALCDCMLRIRDKDPHLINCLLVTLFQQLSCNGVICDV
jgi:hypothetical protein